MNAKQLAALLMTALSYVATISTDHAIVEVAGNKVVVAPATLIDAERLAFGFVLSA